MTDPKHLKRLAEWKSDDILFAVARVPQTGRLFLGCSDFKVYEFDAAAEKPERVPFDGEGHRSYVTGVALAGDVLVSGGYDGRLVWWDIAEHRQVRAVDAHARWMRRVIATPDAARIVSVADDMQCKVWDARTGESVRSFTDHPEFTPHHYPSMLQAVAVNADGKWLATGDKTGHTAIWDLTSFEKVAAVETPVMYTWDPKQRRHSIGGIRGLAFSPDGSKLAIGGIGQIGNIDHLGGPARLEVFEWQTGKRLFEVEDEKRKGLIQQIAWHPSAEWLLTAGGDGKGFLTFYNAGTGELLHQDGNEGHIHGFVVDEEWTTVYAACHNRVEKWGLIEG
jgi:WD40 repeat protein